MILLLYSMVCRHRHNLYIYSRWLVLAMESLITCSLCVVREKTKWFQIVSWKDFGESGLSLFWEASLIMEFVCGLTKTIKNFGIAGLSASTASNRWRSGSVDQYTSSSGLYSVQLIILMAVDIAWSRSSYALRPLEVDHFITVLPTTTRRSTRPNRRFTNFQT